MLLVVKNMGSDMGRFHFSRLLLCLPFLLLSQMTKAEDLKSPTESILLTVSGNISVHNNNQKEAVLDLPLIRTFPEYTIETETPWTDGITSFTGIRIKDLMAFLKSDGKLLEATALNDYSVEIPMEDIQNHDVIIAYTKNGKPMTVRDKGPLWIIYPWTDKPELKTELYHSRSIWQLIKLNIQ
ncbi:molybdopterin-dependent oxidoreductase [Sneathiella limimaris]|uniref:molybdopterin-dependent oxidoreductase n=1 Tax=Sneathiella limimaris TaxID=1964213 RepID=UPI00146A52BA|nr:molybdopterin-dependent oxidoreductase [Sneathiella limimaris]